MTAALSGEQRTLLERFVQRTRSSIEDDLGSTLEGRFGIHIDGGIEPVESLTLSNAQIAIRADLIEIVEFLRAEGEDASGSVERLIREAAFTHTNRLIAVRVAEAIGLLPETMANGVSSSGFRDFSELAPLIADTDWGRFAIFVRLCADELAADVPALFDPRNPLLELEMSEAVLARVIDAMQELPADVWAAPDTLGWAYQFFNTGEERSEIKKRGAPKNSLELAVTNQFFTPSYVVDFLVQNGLGAHLAAAFPQLVDDLPLMIEVPTERTDVDLERVSVLDPACGSGHFLLGAYDVLEKAWQCAGVDPEAAAPHIVSSLWGIDIDPRATQIAQAAVMFRARRHCRDSRLPAAHLICARALPWTPHAEAMIAELPEHVGRAVRSVTAELADAPILGPLLKIEKRLDREARDIFGTGKIEGTLAEAASGNAGALARDVLATMQVIADSTESTPAQRLFIAEAHDAVRFVEAMTRRYTAVLMNPPFGDPVASSKPYLKAAYEWIPATSDLFALFVGRGLELTDTDGSMGAITSRVGFFLTSFEKWREQVLLRNVLGPVVDLGERVMEQATVEAAAYVLRPSGRRRPANRPVFIRALTVEDRAREIPVLIDDARRRNENSLVFRPDLEALSQLDGSPVAYWIEPSDVSVLLEHKPFEPAHGVVRVGLQTSDDFRFVRAWWEVATSRMTGGLPGAKDADERMQLERGARWAPIVKGGTSQPWFSPSLLVVDWENDGRNLRDFGRAVLRNVDAYFKPGFSWTLRAPRLVPYVVPSGCIPSVSRYQAFPAEDPYSAVGIVASNVASAFCRFYGEKFLWPKFLVDTLKALPIPQLDTDLATRLSHHVESRVADRRSTYQALEPFREFVAPTRIDPDLSWDRRSLLGAELDADVARAYGLSPEAAKRVETDLQEALTALAGDTSEDENDDDVPQSGGWGDRLVSYLVGVAFGRWDVRIGKDPSTAPQLPAAFDPPSPIPPGALVDSEGHPAASAPDGYPIDLPPHGLLIDQAGHPWGIEDRVREAARIFHGNDHELDEAIEEAMTRPSVAGYLQRAFFRTHEATYTGGRRKAPIYWQLQVPSKQWGIWLYAPRLSREMLFAIVRETEQRQRLAEQQIAYLQRESETGGGGKSASALAKELEAEQKLSVELSSFRAEAERIANLGWEPDLDDGMVLNAAPLADLFPAWKDAAAYRKELRAGKYEWAAVARFADEL